MRNLARIVAAYQATRQSLAVATLIKTSGENHHHPGERMLVFLNRETVGSMGGGFGDRAIVAKARTVMENGRAELLTADGMEIFIEPVAKPSRLIGFLQNILDLREMGVIATVCRVAGRTAARAGDRLMLDESGDAESGLHGEPALQSKMLADAREVLQTGCSLLAHYQWAAGTADVFIEAIHPATPLVVFAGSYEAAPLARLAREIGFHVTLVDGRPAGARGARFPEADLTVEASPENIYDNLALDGRTAGVIIGHNYQMERAWLRALLPIPLAYLGLPGSSERVENMLTELSREEFLLNAGMLEKLHHPVVLRLDPENAEEAALAILVQIQAVMSAGHRGALREKTEQISTRLALSHPALAA